jgi:DNA-binding transcriptional MerR regulator
VNAVTVCDDARMAAEPGELSLDDLAERAGVAPRTIRYYQSKGILPKPRHDGRDARYDDGHLARLRLIGELQERGLKLDAVRELLALEAKGGRSVVDWLGLDEVLRNPWVEDGPRTMTLAEVHEVLGDRPRRLVGSLVDAGVLSHQDDGRFFTPSQALLDLTLRLVDAGATIDIATRAETLLRKRLARAADDLVDLFHAETGRAFAGHGSAEEVADALATLRPIALDAAGLILAQEIERGLRRLAAAGPRRKRP